jgi:uncharacterized protein GlcG (DUF336 family)
MTEAQSRGIGTLPGGIPLYKNGHLVGGIGVFFPGETGQSDFEQGFVHADVRAANGLPPQTTEERTNATRVIEAEYIALQVALNQQTVAGVAPLAGYGTTIGRIDLVGITLETVGPHRGGIELVQNAGRALGEGNPDSTNTGDETMPDQPVVPSGIVNLDGAEVADEWLVSPQAGGGLTADEVRDIIERGIAEAGLVRSAIRLPIGQRSRMVLSVTDTDGNVLGLYRMPDATVFSIDVAVAKARNVAYYADAADLQPEDMIDENNDNNPDVAPGVAFTNRTFRFLATAYYPSGIDGTGGGPFSILNDPNVNPATAENIDNTNPAAANAHTSVLGFDAFNPALQRRHVGRRPGGERRWCRSGRRGHVRRRRQHAPPQHRHHHPRRPGVRPRRPLAIPKVPPQSTWVEKERSEVRGQRSRVHGRSSFRTPDLRPPTSPPSCSSIAHTARGRH